MLDQTLQFGYSPVEILTHTVFTLTCITYKTQHQIVMFSLTLTHTSRHDVKPEFAIQFNIYIN